MTAAALNVRLASGRSRSMRAAMVACKVAGTLTSAASAVDLYAPRLPAQHAPLGQFAHDLLGEKRITGGPLGDRLAQSDQPRGPARAAHVTSAAVSESLSGARAMVCAPCTRASAPSILGTVA